LPQLANEIAVAIMKTARDNVPHDTFDRDQPPDAMGRVSIE
jgi:hypothetical protein